MSEIDYRKVMDDIVLITDSYLGQHYHHENTVSVKEQEKFYIARKCSWFGNFSKTVLDKVISISKQILEENSISSSKLRLTLTGGNRRNRRNTISIRIRKE